MVNHLYLHLWASMFVYRRVCSWNYQAVEAMTLTYNWWNELPLYKDEQQRNMSMCLYYVLNLYTIYIIMYNAIYTGIERANLCTLHGIRELDVQNCAHQSQTQGISPAKIRNSCGEKNNWANKVNSPMSPKKVSIIYLIVWIDDRWVSTLDVFASSLGNIHLAHPSLRYAFFW